MMQCPVIRLAYVTLPTPSVTIFPVLQILTLPKENRILTLEHIFRGMHRSMQILHHLVSHPLLQSDHTLINQKGRSGFKHLQPFLHTCGEKFSLTGYPLCLNLSTSCYVFLQLAELQRKVRAEVALEQKLLTQCQPDRLLDWSMMRLRREDVVRSMCRVDPERLQGGAALSSLVGMSAVQIEADERARRKRYVCDMIDLMYVDWLVIDRSAEPWMSSLCVRRGGVIGVAFERMKEHGRSRLRWTYLPIKDCNAIEVESHLWRRIDFWPD
jgi:hypothetical protein